MAADRVMITRVPQTKNKNKSAFRIDKKEGGREKEESMFVTSLIIFHTLQIGVYCIGREGAGAGYRMTGYKVVVGEWMGCLL